VPVLLALLWLVGVVHAAVTVDAPAKVTSGTAFRVTVSAPVGSERLAAIRVTWEGATVQHAVALPGDRRLPQVVPLTLQAADAQAGGSRSEALSVVAVRRDGVVEAPVTVRVEVDSGRPRLAAGGSNACGGDEVLLWQGRTYAPGTRCGPCGDGRIVCEDRNTLACREASEGNLCGGCGTLTGTLGAPCGTCGGTLACGPRGESLVCEGAVGANDCGGCGPLPGRMGWLCNGTGVWACAAPDRLVCVAPASP
jgi:hypothetical protein